MHILDGKKCIKKRKASDNTNNSHNDNKEKLNEKFDENFYIFSSAE